MAVHRYSLRARVSMENPGTVSAMLRRALDAASVVPGKGAGEFEVRAELAGERARGLNRPLLSELRRAEKKTRRRAEWTHDGVTERFFDYVPKGTPRV